MMKTTIKAITGFGLVVIMTMGMFTLVPNVGTATAYAAVNEPTIRVGLPDSTTRNKSEFEQRYNDYTINYNDKAYTAVEFFDTFKGCDFGIIRTTTGRKKAITVTIREGVTTQTATPSAPVVAEPVTTATPISDSVSISRPANATTTTAALGREGYTSDIEYMLSDEYTEAMRQEFYRLINAHRKANGLSELEVNLELQDYADIRATERKVRSGHTRPDGSSAGSGWFNSKNFMNTRYSENEASNTRFNICPEEQAAIYFNRWKNSDGHNKHMLYDFDSHITMAFGIAPEIVRTDDWVSSPAIFAAGY